MQSPNNEEDNALATLPMETSSASNWAHENPKNSHHCQGYGWLLSQNLWSGPIAKDSTYLSH